MNKITNNEELSIVVPAPGASPTIKKTSLSKLNSNEIRVKMMTMGYCGRDKSIVTGEKPAEVGRIGHEGAGIIVELGTEVKNLKVGQNVAIFPFINKHNIGYDWPDGGKGIFSNYPVIPSEAVHPINKDEITSKEWLSYSLIEPFAGVFRGHKRGEVIKRDLLIILGAGSIGCEQTLLAKYQNPSIKIVLVDTMKERVNLAKQLNMPADYFIHLDTLDEIKKELAEITKYFKDVLIIHSNPYKVSLKQAFKIAPDNSTILFFSGVYDWEKEDDNELGLSINPKEIHYEEYDENNPQFIEYNNNRILLIGSRGFSRDDFSYAADLIIENKIDPLPIVTKILKFDEDIIKKLEIEGNKETNIKILMSHYDEFMELEEK